ncbi:MAG: type II secretion system F family protein [Gammaproteobacteria bacterium]
MAAGVAINQVGFKWEGTDNRGQKVRGKTMAASEAAVRAVLRKQGVVPVRIRKESTLFKGGGKVTPGDIAIFSRQIATMLAAGIPLVQAFDIVGAGHDNPAMQKLILSVRADLESGTALAEALGRHPLYFDDLFVNLVTAGEQAGALDTLLDKIATYKEKTEAIKKKIKKALFYPAAVLVVAFIVSMILLIFVIPQFESLFKGFGADLPAFTRMVIDLSMFVQTKGWAVAIVIGGGVAFYLYTKKRSKKLREFEDRLMLKLPIVGSILVKASIARFARTLSTMFSAGVPLVEALQSVAGATGNIVYEKAVLAMRDEVSTGQRLQRAMENTGLFPNMVIQMIAVGEESGSLDEMSSKVADFYEADVDNAVDSMSSLLEPMIMAILGVLVGGMVVAMYLPIFKMGAVI